jgi:hypothetical protein
MDKVVLQMIFDRFDKLETKVDKLLEFKWKIVGGTILASLILTGLFQIVLALIQSK